MDWQCTETVSSGKNLATVQKIFNFAARIISGNSTIYMMCGAGLADWTWAGWIPRTWSFITRRHYYTRSVALDSLSLPVQFCTNLERPNHVRSTRRDDLLSLPSIRGSAAGKRQFAHRAADQYNSLPPEFTDMSVPVFKRTLKRRLAFGD